MISTDPAALEELKRILRPQRPHDGDTVTGISPQEVLELVETVDLMRALLVYSADCVVAQTGGVRAIGRNRRQLLTSIVNRMLDAADDPATIYAALNRSTSKYTSDRVRVRLNEELVI